MPTIELVEMTAHRHIANPARCQPGQGTVRLHGASGWSRARPRPETSSQESDFINHEAAAADAASR